MAISTALIVVILMLLTSVYRLAKRVLAERDEP
jgi:hypothetical protein